LLGVLGGLAVARAARAQAPAPQTVQVGYLRWTEPRPTISLLDKPAPDDGLAGAKLAMDDNNTTGRFMGQSYALTDVPLRGDDDSVAELGKLAGQGIRLVLTDMPADGVVKLADAAKGASQTVFNVAAPDDALRGADCRADLVNVSPSRAMLADAVAQYLVWKRWSRWFLVFGSHPEDHLLADAYRRSAKRFGATIVLEREYKDTGGARQTDSGIVETQGQMPVFTQGAPAYDVLVAADENEVFAGYLPYRTWDPRPVVGSAGLRPQSWDASSESWGGAQVQSRFNRLFHRAMTSLDMQAWTACRMIGEAASRTHSADPAQITAYMRGPDFGVAAYKGQRLTIRDWDGQLRQPILLADGRSVVSISPQPGFLHQVTELDTLGVDRPETTCKLR
jgi:ABC transporter substrate binding protein (PQQ-dependent alcohol dehydrogenase system)